MNTAIFKGAILRKDFSPTEAIELALDFTPASAAELKALGDDKPAGFVAGWASTADLDSYNHKVMPGAFKAAIERRGLRGPMGIKLLTNHDHKQVAGMIEVLEYRKGRLWIEAQLNLNLQWARDAHEIAVMLGGTNFSVGFMVEDYEIKTDKESKQEFIQINAGDLFEVSIVPFPGNENCGMLSVKTTPDTPVATVAEFEKSLVVRGLAKSRTDAHNITLAVKACLHLFQKGAEAHEADAAEEKPNLLLDSAQLNQALSLTAQLKQLLAPVAK